MRLLIATALMAWAASASAQEDLSYHFGYALQAAGMCSELQVRADTEQKADSKYGSSVRDGGQYTDGLYAAMDDSSGVCNNAWQRYGCSGNVEPRLLQTSAQASFNSRCEY